MPAPQPPPESEVIRLAKLVKLMRSAQALYFQDRSQVNLRLARDLEQRVDKAVGWVIAHRQGTFGYEQQADGPRRIEIDPPRPGPYGGPA